uniref:Uncharacterized protein n=1 Tax=Magallana gigas TaxID=29159 RepID=A0A8W8JGF9_MAGGI
MLQSNGDVILNSRCDGQMETGNVFTINYTAFNSHCNCTITPRFNGSLFFQTHTKTENCSTEIAIHRLQQSEFNTLITIPCKDGGRALVFSVTQDSVFYITSRSTNTTIDPEIFSQYIVFSVKNIPPDTSSENISVVCGSPLGAESTITTTCTSDLKDDVSGKAFLSLQIPLAIFVVISIVSTIMNMYSYIHFKSRKKCGSKNTNVQISPRSGTEATAETYTELGNTVSENQYDSVAGQDNYTHMNV